MIVKVENAVKNTLMFSKWSEQSNFMGKDSSRVQKDSQKKQTPQKNPKLYANISY